MTRHDPSQQPSGPARTAREGARSRAVLLAVGLFLLVLVLSIGAYLGARSYFGDGNGPGPAPERTTSPSPVTPIEEPTGGAESTDADGTSPDDTSPTRFPLTEGPSDQVVHPTEEDSPS